MSRKYCAKKYCVVVLGMHRSGTSALTRQVMNTGFELISESLPPHKTDNPGGYWESRKMVNLNQRFLQELGSNWKDPKPLRENFHNATLAKPYQLEIDALIEAGLSRNKQIVMKDPRLCRLLPLWLPSIQKYFDHLAVMLINRKADAVFQSLANRRHSLDIAGAAIVDRDHAHALWSRYKLEAELHSAKLNRKVFSYEQWREQPEEITSQIFDFLKSSLPGASLKPGRSEIKALF